MNTKKIKILIAMIFFVILLFIKNSSYAISVSLSQTSVSMKVGNTSQVTITGNDAIGNVSVSSSNSQVATASLSTNWIENNSATLTISAKAAGSATITITGKMANSAGTQEIPISQTINVNVTSQTENGGSTGNGGSSGSSNGNTSGGTRNSFFKCEFI